MNYRKDKLIEELIKELENDSAWLTKDEQDMLRSKLEAWNKLVDGIYFAKGRKN